MTNATSKEDEGHADQDMRNRHNEIILSLILVSGIAAFALRHLFYLKTSPTDVLIDFLFLLAVSLPFILYILFITRKERNTLINKLYINKLTGLPNREQLRLDVNHPQAILFLINIDAFKEINDFYGYIIGDSVIEEMAGRLRKLIGSRQHNLFRSAVLYKLETDEFALLVHRTFPHSQIIRAAQLISHVINETHFSFEKTEVRITATIGVAVGGSISHLTDNGFRAPGILAKADMALKTAKKCNYNFLIYDETMKTHKQYQENIQWAKKLKDSINSQKIIPYFQPIYNNHSGLIEKHECLIRILDDNQRIIYPSAFLQISKRSHLYPKLTRIMFRRALQEALKDPDCEYTINISVEDIDNYETSTVIFKELEEAESSKFSLCFEILETESIQNLELVQSFIHKIKQLGCSVAIDDFGSGYSNFNYLLELDVDYIKLDSSLIKNLAENRNALYITETIVEFCRKLKIKTIAEHVHTKEVHDIVLNLGIDYSQGFYLGKPMKEPCCTAGMEVRTVTSRF